MSELRAAASRREQKDEAGPSADLQPLWSARDQERADLSGEGGRSEQQTQRSETIPARAKWYIAFVVAAGACILLYSIFQVFQDSSLYWLSLVILTIVASNLTITLPLTRGSGQSVSITMGDVFVFMAVLLFGPPVAVLAAVAEGMTMNIRARMQGHYKQLFNLGQLAISAFVVATLFYRLQGIAPPLEPGSADLVKTLASVGVCALAYFVLNTGLVSVGLALTTRRPIVQLWIENFTWTWVTQFSGAAIGTLSFFILGASLPYLFVAALSVVLVYYAYKSNLDRIKQTQEHLQDVQTLLAEKVAAEEALRRAKQNLEIRVEERTAELRQANERLWAEVLERKAAQKALAAEKDRLAVTLRSIGDGVITTDTQGRVVLVNAAAEELTGWSQIEAEGRPLNEVYEVVSSKTGRRKPNIAERVLEKNRVLSVRGKDAALVTKDGDQRLISHSAAPIRGRGGEVVGVVVVFRDISYQNKMEAELLKAQKLESLGALAGGIAHDFNNILAGILLQSQLAQLSYMKNEDPLDSLRSIEKATEKASGLTTQLLTFAKGGAPVKESASIGDLLEETVTFCLRGSGIKCRFELPDDLWVAEVDKGQISQVINNLILNAKDAMPSGGTVTVRAENISISPESDSTELPQGPYLRVWVEDEGVGIPADDLKRIFEPYFSTKPSGHGLGLASTYSIVRRHGGAIEVDSRVGKGTTFVFYLPADPDSIAQQLDKKRRADEGSGRVLLMDDDEMIQSCGKMILQRLGYEAEVASDGEEACRKYELAVRQNKKYSVVILDLTVQGGMGGKRALEEIQKLDPGVCAVVSSGYSADPIMSDPEAHGFKAVLAKPYTMEELSRTLSAVSGVEGAVN